MNANANSTLIVNENSTTSHILQSLVIANFLLSDRANKTTRAQDEAYSDRNLLLIIQERLLYKYFKLIIHERSLNWMGQN